MLKVIQVALDFACIYALGIMQRVVADVRAAIAGGVSINLGGCWVRALPQYLDSAAANEAPLQLAYQLPLLLVTNKAQISRLPMRSRAK